MTIDTIIAMLASVPFWARRRFDNPSHSRHLFFWKLIVVWILTSREKTLREIKFVARLLGKISN